MDSFFSFVVLFLSFGRKYRTTGIRSLSTRAISGAKPKRRKRNESPIKNMTTEAGPTVAESIARLLDDESAARLAAEREFALGTTVAKLSSVVLVEDISRNSEVVDTESEERALLQQQHREEQEVLHLTESLQSDANALLAEVNQLDAMIAAAEVLQSSLLAAEEDVRQTRTILEEDKMLLRLRNQRLAELRVRLECVPAESHAALDHRLSNIEKIVGADPGNGNSGGAEEDVSASTTRPYLFGLWQSQVVSHTTKYGEIGQAQTTSGQALDEVSYLSPDDRANAVLLRHEALCQVLDALFDYHEDALLSCSERKRATLCSISATSAKEIAALDAPRKYMKQIEDEQQYHIHRGTFIKEKTGSITHDELAAQQVKGKHTNLCSGLIRLRDDIKFTANDVRDLKRSLEDTKRCTRAEEAVLLAKRQELDKDANELAATRKVLEAEGADIRNLKTDLTRVLQFVRLKNKTSVA